MPVCVECGGGGGVLVDTWDQQQCSGATGGVQWWAHTGLRYPDTVITPHTETYSYKLAHNQITCQHTLSAGCIMSCEYKQ